MTAAPEVLFIAGFPRSGSTVLERMLAEHPDVVGAGEVRRLWERGLSLDERCGCGKRFSECDFWRSVMRDALGSDEPASVAELAREATDELTYRWAARAIVGRGKKEHTETVVQQFGVKTRALYEAIGRNSGAAVVVDSSKDPVYALFLRDVVGLRVRLLHLVRDSRGVSYSWLRRRRRPEAAGKTRYMPHISPRGVAYGWILQNAVTELVARQGFPSVRLRYEDLVENPTESLLDVSLALGLSTTNRFDGIAQRRLQFTGVHHSVSGNPLRFDQGGACVRPDLEWRDAMTPRDFGLVSAISSPGLVRYGYSLGR